MKNFIYGLIVGVISVFTVSAVVYERVTNNLIDDNQKKQEFYDVFYKWLQKKETGKGLADYFIRNNYRRIAIYGMKELGELLCDELLGTDSVCIKYAIDKNTNMTYKNIPIVSPDSELPDVDLIVVTAIHYFNEIEDLLKQKVTCPVVSIEDVVFS